MPKIHFQVYFIFIIDVRRLDRNVAFKASGNTYLETILQLKKEKILLQSVNVVDIILLQKKMNNLKQNNTVLNYNTSIKCKVHYLYNGRQFISIANS